MEKLGADSRAPKVRGLHDSYVAGYNKGYARGMQVNYFWILKKIEPSDDSCLLYWFDGF
jgi:hypothetical protein